MESEDYDLFAHEAQRIVAQVIAQSLVHLRETTPSEDTGNVRGRFLESENQSERDTSRVQWPKIGEFTSEDVGIDKIQEYIEKVNYSFVYLVDRTRKKSCFRNGKQHQVVKMPVGSMQLISSIENLRNSPIFISIE